MDLDLQLENHDMVPSGPYKGPVPMNLRAASLMELQTQIDFPGWRQLRVTLVLHGHISGPCVLCPACSEEANWIQKILSKAPYLSGREVEIRGTLSLRS